MDFWGAQKIQSYDGLSVCCKNHAISYSNRISYSKSSFRKILFLFCHASLGIFLSEILLFFTQKSPTLFAKKGGKMKVFF